MVKKKRVSAFMRRKRERRNRDANQIATIDYKERKEADGLKKVCIWVPAEHRDELRAVGEEMRNR